MWSTPLRVWLALATTVSAAAPSVGYLHIFDSQTTRETAFDTISPDATRMVLASRLGVDGYHSVDDISDAAVEAVNYYGRQRQLSHTSSSQKTAVFLSTNEWSPEGVHRFSRLSIPDAPASSEAEELFGAFALQSKDISGLSARKQADEMHEDEDGTIEGDASVLGIRKTASRLNADVQHYLKQGYTVMVLTSPTKPRSDATFGPYKLPSPKSHKRQAEESDELQSDFLTAPFSSLSNETSAEAEDPSSSNSTSPALKGIIPRCHTTKHACEAATRNCTGHGKCTLAFTQRNGQDSDAKGTPCYSCACSPTVRKVGSNGKKTTVWGGPACQKKNVAPQFWILAFSSVALLFVVGWAVGLVWEMGDQELPSVIGAGVSGVPKK